MYLETFRIKECDKAVIARKRKMSDPKPKVVKEVADKAVLAEILSLLARLPEEGEEMIKIGDVATIDVRLFLGSVEIGNFTYFEKRIKAPDTAFYSNPPPEEAVLLSLLEALLAGKLPPGR